MAPRPTLFRQSDVTRAVRAVRAAGEGVGRVEIDRDGRIVITTRDDAEPWARPPGLVEQRRARRGED